MNTIPVGSGSNHTGLLGTPVSSPLELDLHPAKMVPTNANSNRYLFIFFIILKNFIEFQFKVFLRFYKFEHLGFA